jgi:hypothetical protein
MKIILSGDRMRRRPEWLPPRNTTERQKREWKAHMIAWTCERLDEKFKGQFEDRVMSATADPSTNAELEELIRMNEKRSVDDALDAAERGDWEPLLALRPGLAKFVKRRHGRGRYPRRQKVEVHPTARWAARCIQREIWPENFGRKSRRLSDPLSIRELVAAWLEVDEDEIHWKAPGRSKPRKSAR